MKWIDYREKLGIGFSDKHKAEMLRNKIATLIDNSSLNADYSSDDYYRFCLMVGIKYQYAYEEQSTALARIFLSYELSVSETLSYYIAFVNCKVNGKKRDRRMLIEALEGFLSDLNIPYEVYEDKDGWFVFPKGAEELDNALVSEPLEWLKDYPGAHKTFVIALKQYSEGVYIRDTADNLRKTLEAFLQEFLGNSKNLETNKNEICKYLGAQNVDAGIAGLFQPLINSYKRINDSTVKHNDAIDPKLLEFMLYQTGLLIRMVLSVKQSEQEVQNNAD